MWHLLLIGLVCSVSAKAELLNVELKSVERVRLEHKKDKPHTYVHFQVRWNNFDFDDHQQGFRFRKARGIRLLSPKLPKDCKFLGITGTLSHRTIVTYPLSAVLKGSGCRGPSTAYAFQEFQVKFSTVPAYQGRPEKSPVELSISPFR